MDRAPINQRLTKGTVRVNRTEMALAYRNIGVAYLQAAEVMEGAEVVNEQPPAPQGLAPLAPLAAQSPTPTSLPVAGMPGVRVNSAAVGECPIHGEPLRDSKYAGKPAYCSKPGSDPAW